MRKRKLLALALAFITALSCMSVTAFAGSGPTVTFTAASTTPTIYTTQSTPVQIGYLSFDGFYDSPTLSDHYTFDNISIYDVATGGTALSDTGIGVNIDSFSSNNQYGLYISTSGTTAGTYYLDILVGGNDVYGTTDSRIPVTITVDTTYYSLNSASSLPEELSGGVSFSVNDFFASSSQSGKTVTARAKAVDGYEAVLSSSDVTFTTNANGVATFTMPSKAVTVTATYTPYTYLDLESSNTYQDTHTINQTYTLTQDGDTVYTDVTKVKLEWTLPEIAASFTLNKTWDPDNLCWVDSKNTAAIGQKQATFTFTNYSSVKVYAELSFLKSIGSGNSSAIVDSVVLDTVVNEDENRTLKSGSVANGATFTHTYTPTASEFNSLSVGSGTYGVYTATIKNVCKVTYDVKDHADSISDLYAAKGSTISSPIILNPDSGYVLGNWYTDENCTTGNEWNFATDTVTEDMTLYAGWLQE